MIIPILRKSGAGVAGQYLILLASCSIQGGQRSFTWTAGGGSGSLVARKDNSWLAIRHQENFGEIQKGTAGRGRGKKRLSPNASACTGPSAQKIFLPPPPTKKESQENCPKAAHCGQPIVEKRYNAHEKDTGFECDIRHLHFGKSKRSRQFTTNVTTI